MQDTQQEQKQNKKSKEEHVLDYIKSLDMIEQAMQPYREHKSALKKNYAENSWLSKDEQSLILKAYRMLRQNESAEDVQRYYDLLKNKMGL